MSGISSKLPNVGTTIFTLMSNMAAKHGAINLSQGFPDFSVPEPLVEYLNKYLIEGMNQYPPMIGVEYLREQISKKVLALYGAKVDLQSEITVTSGATEALYVAIQTIVNSGDEVIIFDPAYDSYEPAILLAGGKAVHLTLDLNADEGLGIDWEKLSSLVNKNTKAVIINSPHNPSGRVLSQSDVQALEELIATTGIFVISDEVYEHMVYDVYRHISLLESSIIREKCFVISSFGKTYHATGWKVAYCIAPEALTMEFRKIHQFVTFTTHTPTQWAIAEFMEHHKQHYLGLPDFYQAKRDLFLSEMKDSRFTFKASAGTYFQLAEYSEISDLSDTEFANHLTKEIGVAAIPISVFCEKPMASKYVRFCFAKNDQTLIQACERLKAI